MLGEGAQGRSKGWLELGLRAPFLAPFPRWPSGPCELQTLSARPLVVGGGSQAGPGCSCSNTGFPLVTKSFSWFNLCHHPLVFLGSLNEEPIQPFQLEG